MSCNILLNTKKIDLLNVKIDMLLDKMSLGEKYYSFMSEGSDFSGYSNYTPEMEIKYIDWKKSMAKHQILSKNYESGLHIDSYFIIDQYSDFFFDIGEKKYNKFLLLQELIYIIASIVIKNNGKIYIGFLQKKQDYHVLGNREQLNMFLLKMEEILKNISKNISNRGKSNDVFDSDMREKNCFLFTDRLEIESFGISFSNINRLFYMNVFDSIENNLELGGLFFLKNMNINGKNKSSFFITSKEREEYKKERKKQISVLKEILNKYGVKHFIVDEKSDCLEEIQLFFNNK